MSILLATIICGRCSSFGIIELNFLIDLHAIFIRIAAFCSRHVHDMHNHSRPFYVTQELMTESHAFVGPFNKTGKIRHDEAASITNIYNPEVRGNGCKVIRRNFRFCGRNNGQ